MDTKYPHFSTFYLYTFYHMLSELYAIKISLTLKRIWVNLSNKQMVYMYIWCNVVAQHRKILKVAKD